MVNIAQPTPFSTEVSPRPRRSGAMTERARLFGSALHLVAREAPSLWHLEQAAETQRAMLLTRRLGSRRLGSGQRGEWPQLRELPAVAITIPGPRVQSVAAEVWVVGCLAPTGSSLRPRAAVRRADRPSRSLNEWPTVALEPDFGSSGWYEPFFRTWNPHTFANLADVVGLFSGDAGGLYDPGAVGSCSPEEGDVRLRRAGDATKIHTVRVFLPILTVCEAFEQRCEAARRGGGHADGWRDDVTPAPRLVEAFGAEAPFVARELRRRLGRLAIELARRGRADVDVLLHNGGDQPERVETGWEVQ